jgi:hypothetical protein
MQPNAYIQMFTYFEGLTNQMTTKVLNQDFIAALKEYCINYDNCFQTAVSTVEPQYFGPYLLTAVPTISPATVPVSKSSNNSLSVILNNLALIVGTCGGLLCLLLILGLGYYYYQQRKKAREDAMVVWQKEADNADITIYKKNGARRSSENIHGMNPAFKAMQRPVKVVSDAASAVRRASVKALRRLSHLGGSSAHEEIEVAPSTHVLDGGRLSPRSRPLSSPRQQLNTSTQPSTFYFDDVRSQHASDALSYGYQDLSSDPSGLARPNSTKL